MDARFPLLHWIKTDALSDYVLRYVCLRFDVFLRPCHLSFGRMRFISLILFSVLLNACTPANQPLRHSVTGFDTTILQLKDGGTVYIAPLKGVARPFAQIFAENLVDSLADLNIAATTYPVEHPSHILNGQVLIDHSRQENILEAEIYWQFKSLDDENKIRESTQKVRIERYKWEYGDAAFMKKMSYTAAVEVAGYLQDKQKSYRKAPDHDKDILVSIGTIKGARADGAESLKKAMGYTIEQAGAYLIDQPQKGSYILDSEIDILEPFEGHERIKVSWIVKDDQGVELARAQQDNRLPTGQLDQPWGSLSYFIAKAALPSIGEIIQRHKSEQQFERSRQQNQTTTLPGARHKLVIPPF